MTDDFAVRAENLSKRFSRNARRGMSLKDRVLRRSDPGTSDHIWALRDASFEIPRGQTFGLIGHNGAGKSTALKVLAGIYEPTSGEVTVSGRVSALLELGAGFHPDLTGRENARMNGSILGLSRRQIDDALPEIIEFSGLADFIDDPVKTYSSGMYARLGFAIAVNVDPEILIVDEILAVGDEQFQRKCFDHMYDLRKRGTTIIVVSHALTTVEMICDSVAWLDHGHVRQLGAATPVVQAYLADVNRQGAASDDRSDTLTARSEAAGTGEVRLTHLEILSPQGQPVAEPVSGHETTFRLHYRATEALPSVIAGIAIHTEAGLVVCAPNSRENGYLPLPAGEGYIDFRAPHLLLNPGNYEISTYLSAFGHWFDARTRWYPLKVRGDGGEEAGLTTLPGGWEVHPSPPV